ncbi:hypothetical protein [Elizabethkingia ursingii]|nr:hypothetical protein [Elizabethkingia ursingii]
MHFGISEGLVKLAGGVVSRLMKKYTGTYGIGMQYAAGMPKH